MRVLDAVGPRCALALFFFLFAGAESGLAWYAPGATEDGDQSKERAPAASAPAEQDNSETAEPPPPPPKYLDLRYDEDYSYLDGPEGSYTKDIFDPIKWIHITDDLTLTIGGEVKGRLESLTNPTLGSTEPAQDTYFLHRYFLSTDLRYRKLARVFFQGINAMVEDLDFPLTPTMENRWDFYQLFADLRFLGEDVPLTLRVGRQELSYGRQRLISPLDWANTRRRFDGAKLFYESEYFDLDLFFTWPIIVDVHEGYNRKPDHYREQTHFYGAYSTYRPFKDHYLDYYFLALRDTGNLENPNGRFGDLSLYTMGGRAGGKWNQFDYDSELAGQWGKWAGDTIQAWLGALDAGWTAKLPMKPRFGAGFDFGSGDEDPTDDLVQTSNQLYPLGHAHLGYLDLFGRQNVLATNLNFAFNPLENVTTRLAWYTFWNDEVRDDLYNAGGAPIRRDRLGNAGHDVGNELDLTIGVELDRHTSLLFGYSHFWGTNFIRSTGPSQDADLLYFQYAFRF